MILSFSILVINVSISSKLAFSPVSSSFLMACKTRCQRPPGMLYDLHVDCSQSEDKIFFQSCRRLRSWPLLESRFDRSTFFVEASYILSFHFSSTVWKDSPSCGCSTGPRWLILIFLCFGERYWCTSDIRCKLRKSSPIISTTAVNSQVAILSFSATWTRPQSFSKAVDLSDR